MKTTHIFSNSKKLLLLLLLAVIALFTISCDQKKWGPHEEVPNMGYDTETLQKETFLISPEGAKIIALNGALEIDFPAGVVSSRTYIDIFTYPCTQVNFDKFNMMKCAIGIEIGENQEKLLESATVKMKYDLNRFLQGVPESESSLTIYRVYPDVYNPVHIVPLGECCVDGSCKMISSCFERGGNFIVGVN